MPLEKNYQKIWNKNASITISNTNVGQDRRASESYKMAYEPAAEAGEDSSINKQELKQPRKTRFLRSRFYITGLLFLHLIIHIYNFNDQKRCELVSDKLGNSITL